MESKIVEIIIQGGSLGIVLVLIYYFWQRDKMMDKTQNNHLKHLTDAQEKIADSNNRLSMSLTKLAEKVEDCPFKK